jgi:hypothetical protein
LLCVEKQKNYKENKPKKKKKKKKKKKSKTNAILKYKKWELLRWNQN